MITKTANRTRLSVSGTTYDFDFRIDDSSELLVYGISAGGAATELTTGFTVSFSAEDEEGTVTFDSEPSTYAEILMLRAKPYTQSVDIPVRGGFSEGDIEKALDAIVIQVQQLKELIEYSVRYDSTEVAGETDASAFVADINAAVTDAEAAEVAAEAAQAAAETARDLAQDYAATVSATSTTSNSITVAEKTFTIEAGKQFAAGMFIQIFDAADDANYMYGQVTSYSGTTLVVDVQAVGGSGTKTAWNIYLSGVRGATGETGATGPAGAGSGDVLGPASNTDNFVPQWNGADSKTLKNGLQVGTGANMLIQTTAASKLPAVDGSLLTNLPSQIPDQTGHSGQFLKTNGSAADWDTPVSLPTWAADDTAVIASALALRYDGHSASYVKVKEITILGSGTVNVAFSLHHQSGASGTVYGRIYKNGSAVGTERSNNSTTAVEYTQDISGLANGDKIQIYAKSTPGGEQAIISNFKLLATQCTLDLGR